MASAHCKQRAGTKTRLFSRSAPNRLQNLRTLRQEDRRFFNAPWGDRFRREKCLMQGGGRANDRPLRPESP